MPEASQNREFITLPDGRRAVIAVFAFRVDEECKVFDMDNVPTFLDLVMVDAERVEAAHDRGAPSYHYDSGSVVVYANLDDLIADRALIESGKAL
jgi:hypothetical protein